MAIKINNVDVIDNSSNFIGAGLTATKIYANNSLGVSGDLLSSTGVGITWRTPSAGFSTVTEFLSSGTWTKPTEANFVMVELYGAGAGGQGTRINQGGNADAAFGGGGGSFIRRLFKSSELTSTVTVTIGAGGVGGVSTTTGSTNEGIDGGNSTFGSYLIAFGGNGNGNGAGVFITDKEDPNSDKTLGGGFKGNTSGSPGGGTSGFGGGGGGSGDRSKTATQRSGGVSFYGGGGGGGGAGNASELTGGTGGSRGGNSSLTLSLVNGEVVGGGAAGGATGANGSNGTNLGDGGGGGGGIATGTPGNGGNGAIAGGGGGGGQNNSGGALTGGNGGAGGNGYCIVYSW